MGIISPVGAGIRDTIEAIKNAKLGIKPLTLFPTNPLDTLPVGEVDTYSLRDNVPRTHALALIAAEEALKNVDIVPDALVIGVTTGGMSTTEELLKQGSDNPALYNYHSTGSVGEYLAQRTGCAGPILTVSTACSSGAVALKIALELLRRGKAKHVLAGGADSLCRLTYYGFNSLQLVDPTGAHPFDRNRRGMSVGEGSAMLLLTAAESPPADAIAELMGAGLSCDAYHPASPQPQGEGVLHAMKEALSDAGISQEDVDYIHLHGTGTVDNDRAEASAIRALFEDRPIPPLSSIKGSFGHSLGAAGAIGAVVSALSISQGIFPANTGFRDADPELGLIPIDAPQKADTSVVLANSFGFGGNNAVLVVGHPMRRRSSASLASKDVSPLSFTVLGSACITGAGNTERTYERLRSGADARGLVSPSDALGSLSEKYVRRLQRLPRMALSLAVSACSESSKNNPPASIYFGSGWGGLSETYDFLSKLFSSDERFSSPTDFIGSVHNAAAGHVATHFKAKGPNVTCTGGDCAFEQALISASILSRQSDDPILVIGADECHERLSPLFDASMALTGSSSDGGGALYLKPAMNSSPWQICPLFMSYSGSDERIIQKLIHGLGGVKRINDQVGAVLAGIPASQRELGKGQLDSFLSMSGFPHPVIDYRQFTGEYASASAVATVMGVLFVKADGIPGFSFNPSPTPLKGRGILVMGFGRCITAVEIKP